MVDRLPPDLASLASAQHQLKHKRPRLMNTFREGREDEYVFSPLAELTFAQLVAQQRTTSHVLVGSNSGGQF